MYTNGYIKVVPKMVPKVVGTFKIIMNPVIYKKLLRK